MKSKINYNPPNRPLVMKPRTDEYRKNYDKIFRGEDNMKKKLKKGINIKFHNFWETYLTHKDYLELAWVNFTCDLKKDSFDGFMFSVQLFGVAVFDIQINPYRAWGDLVFSGAILNFAIHVFAPKRRKK